MTTEVDIKRGKKSSRFGCSKFDQTPFPSFSGKHSLYALFIAVHKSAADPTLLMCLSKPFGTKCTCHAQVLQYSFCILFKFHYKSILLLNLLSIFAMIFPQASAVSSHPFYLVVSLYTHKFLPLTLTNSENLTFSFYLPCLKL